MAARTYFKAIREDGTSFHSRSFAWATEPGAVTTLDSARRGSTDAADYLSVATVATDCTGFSWPCRLLEVAPVGRTWAPHPSDLPNKRAGVAFRTVRELPAWQVFGSQGEYVVALIERAKLLDAAEVRTLYAVGGAAWYAARDAARDAAWYAAWYAAGDAAGALTLRDLIGTGSWTQDAYDILTRPWATTIGAVHPDDKAVA